MVQDVDELVELYQPVAVLVNLGEEFLNATRIIIISNKVGTTVENTNDKAVCA